MLYILYLVDGRVYTTSASAFFPDLRDFINASLLDIRLYQIFNVLIRIVKIR